MGLFKAIGKILGETPVGKLFDRAIEAVLPDKLTEAERAQLKAHMQAAEHDRMIELQRVAMEQEAAFNQRIKDMEGTASDLRTVPLIGPLVLFLRGVQRPLWGFATLWMDARWLFGSQSMTESQETALIVINTLVLGFLFGERTLKNLTPLITQVFGKGKAS